MQIKMHVVRGEVPCLLSKGWLKENGAVLSTSSEELALTKKQISAPMTEGPSGHFELDMCSREKDFGEGRTRTLRTSPTMNRNRKLKDSPSTPSRPLVACCWNPLSSSGRHRFWHIHCTLTPKLIIYSFPVAVQQWLSTSNPSELYLQPRFRSARDQLRLYLSGMHWQHLQGRYFLLDTSKITGSWTLVTLQALLDEPRGLLKHVTGSGTLNVTRGGTSSNASCIMSCLRPLTQRIPFSSNRCGTKFCQTCELQDGCHERSPCSD